jgi:hypothetical protein
MSDGSLDYMPKNSEVVALCLHLGLAVADIPDDKPEQRRLKFERLNAARHRRPRS